MIYSESSKKTDKNIPFVQQVYKRPHGVSVQNLAEMFAVKMESEEKEFALKVRLNYLNPNDLFVENFTF